MEARSESKRKLMKTGLTGIVHGRIIELDHEPGLPDGQVVTVAIERLDTTPSASPQEVLPTVESWCERIVFDSAVSPTEKVVKGTRLRAETLVAELEQGKNAEQLLTTHPELTPADVEALTNYARTPVGLRRSFGAWANESEELDTYLEWNRQQRRAERREIEG
jgi:uncharacterized protein (DUF433 family)